MKFTFKIQKYQTEAVDSLVKCFEGQQFADKVQYLRDKGLMPKLVKQEVQTELFEKEKTEEEQLEEADNGYRRLMAFKSKIRKALYYQSSPYVIFIQHLLYSLVAVSQSLDRRIL